MRSTRQAFTPPGGRVTGLASTQPRKAWADTATVATYGPDQVDLAFQFDLAAAIVAAGGLAEVALLGPRRALEVVNDGTLRDG